MPIHPLLPGALLSGIIASQPATSNQSSHPVITEILFAVPAGSRGDANQDGKRDAVGDEFIEIVNPSDKPINLKGYVLADAAKVPPQEHTRHQENGKPRDAEPRAEETNQVRFAFPEFTLPPGEVVVVFNGYKQNTPGPVGSQTAPPAKRNEMFHNAWVFSMNNSSQYAAFGNQGDCVTLSSPSGEIVQCVMWGNIEGKVKPHASAKVEKAPESNGSVQRAAIGGDFVPHSSLGGEQGNRPFSPGLFGGEGAGKVAAPAHQADPKQGK